MAVEDAADWEVFLDADAFGSAGTWSGRGVTPAPVRGVFGAPHLAAAAGDWGGVSTSAPAFATAESELPEGAGQGDTLTLKGRAWRVAEIQPDGTGMVRVILEG